MVTEINSLNLTIFIATHISCQLHIIIVIVVDLLPYSSYAIREKVSIVPGVHQDFDIGGVVKGRNGSFGSPTFTPFKAQLFTSLSRLCGDNKDTV